MNKPFMDATVRVIITQAAFKAMQEHGFSLAMDSPWKTEMIDGWLTVNQLDGEPSLTIDVAKQQGAADGK